MDILSPYNGKCADLFRGLPNEHGGAGANKLCHRQANRAYKRAE